MARRGGLTVDDFTLAEDGKPQKIALFERSTTTPLSIVLAIDASESVLRTRTWSGARRSTSVKALLREQDELDLMDFSDTVRRLCRFTNDQKRIDAGWESRARRRDGALTTRFTWPPSGWPETHTEIHAKKKGSGRRAHPGCDRIVTRCGGG